MGCSLRKMGSFGAPDGVLGLQRRQAIDRRRLDVDRLSEQGRRNGGGMRLRGILAAAIAIFALAVLAGAWTFIERSPRPGFVPECVAASGYGNRDDALDRCKEELAELRADRMVVTVVAAGGALLLVSAVIAGIAVLLAWWPIRPRRG